MKKGNKIDYYFSYANFIKKVSSAKPYKSRAICSYNG